MVNGISSTNTTQIQNLQLHNFQTTTQQPSRDFVVSEVDEVIIGGTREEAKLYNASARVSTENITTNLVQDEAPADEHDS